MDLPPEPAAAVAPTPAPPQGDDPEDHRALAGHTYLTPVLQDMIPFATTHFGIRQGFVFQRYPRVPIGVGTTALTTSGILQAFDAGVRITEWLGVRVTGGAQILTGIDVASVILQGASATAQVEGGAIVRVFRSERTGTQIAAQITGGGGGGRDVDVEPLIAGVQQAESFSARATSALARSVLVPTNLGTMAMRGAIAQTITPAIGTLVALEGRRTVNTRTVQEGQASRDSKNEDLALAFSIATTVDGSSAKVPIAGMIEYQVVGSSSAVDALPSRGDTSHYAAAGIYYTGRKNLQLGLGFAMALSLRPVIGRDDQDRPAPSGAPSLYYGQLILRYVW